MLVLEGAGQLEGPVAAEVEEEHGGAVADLPNRAVLVGDDEAGEVLIVEAGLVVQGLDRRAGAGEAAALAAHVDLPAAGDDLPVGLVAVHGDDHAPAAAGDPVVAAGLRQLGERLLEAIDVEERGAAGDVAAVDEDVHAGLRHALAGGLAQEGE